MHFVYLTFFQGKERGIKSIEKLPDKKIRVAVIGHFPGTMHR